MVYTETSTYQYITGDELEEYAVKIYLTVSTKYTEKVIIAKVNSAERQINEHCKQSFSSTPPDGIKDATLKIARKLMFNQMVEDGKVKEGSEKIKDIFDDEIESLLKRHIKTASGVDSIPMSGASRSGQTTDFY